MSVDTLRRVILRCSKIALLHLAVTACSEVTDPNIKHGFYALDTGYSSDVQPPGALYSHCDHALLNSRHVARCGFSFGRHELEQVGYWEIEKRGDKVAVYAMNDQAMAALAKLMNAGSLSVDAYPGTFQPGTGRPPLDFSKIDEAVK